MKFSELKRQLLLVGAVAVLGGCASQGGDSGGTVTEQTGSEVVSGTGVQQGTLEVMPGDEVTIQPDMSEQIPSAEQALLDQKVLRFEFDSSTISPAD